MYYINVLENNNKSPDRCMEVKLYRNMTDGPTDGFTFNNTYLSEQIWVFNVFDS